THATTTTNGLSRQSISRTTSPLSPPPTRRRRTMRDISDERVREMTPKIAAARKEVRRICDERWNGRTGWRTSIPARPEYDSDIIIADGLLEGESLARRVLALEEDERARWDRQFAGREFAAPSPERAVEDLRWYS